MPVGAVIGKGGQSIKLLARRSGAKLVVGSARGEVIITGAHGAVQVAERLLRQQIEAFLTSGSGCCCLR